MNPIKKHYEKLLKGFDPHKYIESNTIQILHRMTKQPDATIADIEICAIWCAIMSWGKPQQALTAINNVMELCEWKPAEYVKFGDCYEVTDDENIYLTLTGKIFRQINHTLRQFYNSHTSIQDELIANPNTTVLDLIQVLSGWCAPARLGSPTRNSACTRLNLLLRWMIRKDDIDLGLWQMNLLQPKNLYAVMDAATAHVAIKRGLISYSKDSWKAVLELTNVYKDWDKQDPLKYDFVFNT